MKVINNPEQYPYQCNKICNADLRYPIIIQEDNVIIDGMHRLS